MFSNNEDDKSKISQRPKKKSVFNISKKDKDQRSYEEDVPRASRTVMSYKPPTIDKDDFRKSSTRSKLPLSSLQLRPFEIPDIKKKSTNKSTDLHSSFDSNSSHSSKKSLDQDKDPTSQAEGTKSLASTTKRSSKDSVDSNSKNHNSKSATSSKTSVSDQEKPTSRSEGLKSLASTAKRSSKDSVDSNSEKSEYYQRKASQSPQLIQSIENKTENMKRKVTLISTNDSINRSSTESSSSSQKSYGFYASNVTSTTSPLTDKQDSNKESQILSNEPSLDEPSNDVNKLHVDKIKYSQEDIKPVGTETVKSDSRNEEELSTDSSSEENFSNVETNKNNQNDVDKNAALSHFNQINKQESFQSEGLNSFTNKSEIDEPLNYQQIQPSYIINDARESMFEFLKNLTENIKETLNCPRAIKIILQTDEGDENEVGSIKLEASDSNIRFIPEKSDFCLDQKKILNDKSPSVSNNICESCNQKMNSLNVSKNVTNKCKKDKPVKKPVIAQEGRIGNFNVKLQVEDGSEDRTRCVIEVVFVKHALLLCFGFVGISFHFKWI